MKIFNLFPAIHEKGFMLYLSSSHLLFLVILAIYWQVWDCLTDLQKRSYYHKLYIFLFSTVSIALMAYFYYRHIKHCDNLGKVSFQAWKLSVKSL